MAQGTPRKQTMVLAPGFIYQDGAFLSPQDQSRTQHLSSRPAHRVKPQNESEEQTFSNSNTSQLEEVLKCARLFLSQHTRLTGSQTGGREEDIRDPLIKTELGPEFGIQVLDGSEWLAANERRKDNTPPKPPSTERKASRRPTPNGERVESPPYGTQDRCKMTMKPESSQDANCGWKIKGCQRNTVKPEVHIYRRIARESPVRDVVVPESPPAERPSRAERRHKNTHKRRRASQRHPPRSSSSLRRLLSKERADRFPVEKQGDRHDIQDYRRMMFIAAETSRALQKERASKNPPDDERLSPCLPPLPQTSLSEAPLVTPGQPAEGAPPRCEFPLHRYFTESLERVPDPSDLAGDPHQFWIGVHHLIKCPSLAHSPLMVGVCQVLCKVLCKRPHDQSCVSGMHCFELCTSS
ncbi:MAG: hypothetical protein M1840_008680 [Geoglossum simile]|nr:MAG: hypothetical protein M1840_008680 [Geoglossum simile]